MLRAAILFLFLGTLYAPQAFAVDTVTQEYPPFAVGGDGIWDATNPAKFQIWSSQVGPLPTGAALLFNITPGYNVIEVLSQTQLDTCDFTYAKETNFARPGVPQESPLIVLLKNPGVQYFTTSDRTACEAGLKLSISVVPNPRALNVFPVGGSATNELWYPTPALQVWADSIGNSAQQGDVLVFTLPISAFPHNLVELPSQAELDACDFTNKREVFGASKSTAGDIVTQYVRLNRTGTYYFACSLGISGSHCAAGQKFRITVGPHTYRGKNNFWVGGADTDFHWKWLGMGHEDAYQTWADSVLGQVAFNDRLIFRSPTEMDAKLLPNREALDNCDFTYALDFPSATVVDGLSIRVLTTIVPGPLYVANPTYCVHGMKFNLTIAPPVWIPGTETPVDLVGGLAPLDKYNLRTGSTTLGNVIADSFALVAHAFSPSPVRFGVFNSGGIGVTIPAGPVDTRHLLGAFRFPGNGLAVKALNGSEIWAMFEHSAKNFGDGAFLQISSNFRVTQVLVPGEGVVVRSVQFYDEHGMLCDFDPDTEYNIAINSFMSDGGDDYTVFKSKTNLLASRFYDALKIIDTDILGFALIGRDKDVLISPLDSRYCTLGNFLLVSSLMAPWEAVALATWPEYKRQILHSVKEFAYAEGDPSFFSADLSELTADDGKGQRFYSAMDDALGAAARIKDDWGNVPMTVKGFMWALLQKMDDFTEAAMSKAVAAGCNDEDDMNIAWRKYQQGVERAVEHPESVLDEWRCVC
eukprot:jgi/Mesvir1/19648/Mv09931-RA.2